MAAVLLAGFTSPLDAPFTVFRYWKYIIELVDSLYDRVDIRLKMFSYSFSFLPNTL